MVLWRRCPFGPVPMIRSRAAETRTASLDPRDQRPVLLEVLRIPKFTSSFLLLWKLRPLTVPRKLSVSHAPSMIIVHLSDDVYHFALLHASVRQWYRIFKSSTLLVIWTISARHTLKREGKKGNLKQGMRAKRVEISQKQASAFQF